MSFVITGSVAYDYLMSYPGRFRDHILPEQLDSLSVSFLADSMRRERGGVAANIVMPTNAPAVKRAAVASYGATITWCEPTLEARERTLSEVVARTGAVGPLHSVYFRDPEGNVIELVQSPD